jgi:hypothetical protein
MDSECVGVATAGMLLRDVKEKRIEWLRNRHNINHDGDVTIESFVHDFEIDQDEQEPVCLMGHPIYRLAEKQIAAMRFCKKRNFFYGKVVDSVDNGVRRYSTEPVPADWVTENMDAAFVKTMKARADDTKFLWIPVGKARPGLVYPYRYNKKNPPIKFQQGKRDTCASSSFASCLNVIGLEDTATWVNAWGRAFLGNPLNDQSSTLQRLIHDLQKSGHQDFNKKWQVQKLKCKTFDIWDLDEKRKKYPKLIQVLGNDGWAGHAITIYDGLIFDSNLKYSVELNRINLEFCIDAVYEGILHGYECVPRDHQDNNKISVDMVLDEEKVNTSLLSKKKRNKKKSLLYKLKKKMKMKQRQISTEMDCGKEEPNVFEDYCIQDHPYPFESKKQQNNNSNDLKNPQEPIDLSWMSDDEDSMDVIRIDV